MNVVRVIRRGVAIVVVAGCTLLAAGAAAQSGPQMPPSIAVTEATQADALRRAQIANETAQARYYAKQAEKDRSGDLPAWLQTVIGGLVAIVGGVVATWFTNRVAARNEREHRRRVYDRQRSQLRLAIVDLIASLTPVAEASGQRPAAFLSEALLYTKPTRPADARRTDDYYLKYDLVDTIYRFCALLGWMEVYRNDAEFLRGSEAENRSLERCFANIRGDLSKTFVDDKRRMGADGWRDGFILEDDQRAIGEKMMARRRADVVIGYAAFCEQLFRDPLKDNPNGADSPTSQNWWIWNATRFFVELGPEPHRDFRHERVKRLFGHLREASAVLDPAARSDRGTDLLRRGRRSGDIASRRALDTDQASTVDRS